MAKEYLKSRDKVVLKMSREGAVEENLVTGETERISQRAEGTELVKKGDVKPPEQPKKHKCKQKYYRQISDKTAVEPTSAAAFDGKSGYVSEQKQYAEGVAESVNTVEAVPAEQSETAEVTDTPIPLQQETPAETHSYSPKVERLERKAKKAHRKVDEAYEKLPKKKALQSERVFDEEKGKAQKRLYFEEEVKEKKPPSKLKFEAKKAVRQAGNTFVFSLHNKVHEVEQENSAVEAAHRSEIVAESAARHIHFERNSQTPYERYSKLEHEVQKADSKLHFEKTIEENPELKSGRNPNKFYQKQRIKREQVARSGGKNTSETVRDIRETAEKISEKVKDFIAKNKAVFIWIGAGLLVIILCSSLFASCAAMLSRSGTTVVSTSYLSEDEDLLGAESAYKALEENLQNEIDNYTATHSYDEYIFNLDEICHDPYVLVSLLSAMNNGVFELEDVQDFLKSLFEMQYALTESVTTETRYRTEIQTQWQLYIDPYTDQPVFDPYTGQFLMIPIEAEVQVPYDYYICTVTLENNGLESLIEELLDDDQMDLYEAYIESMGNREELFN